jgi:hypothetical protein
MKLRTAESQRICQSAKEHPRCSKRSQRRGARFSLFVFVIRVRPTMSTNNEHDFREAFVRNDRLCENSVHGSIGLTTNGYRKLQIKHLAVRPELCRRAPNEFPHSLTRHMSLFQQSGNDRG